MSVAAASCCLTTQRSRSLNSSGYWDAFYPDRIDLGIGRAPGSDRLTAAALSHPRPPVNVQHEFPQMVGDLLGFLNGDMAEGHPLHEITAQPGGPPDYRA